MKAKALEATNNSNVASPSGVNIKGSEVKDPVEIEMDFHAPDDMLSMALIEHELSLV